MKQVYFSTFPKEGHRYTYISDRPAAIVAQLQMPPILLKAHPSHRIRIDKLDVTARLR